MLSNVLMSTACSTADSRIFVYEVTGLRQNERTITRSYPVRNSSSLFIQVPYSRMNDEMRRITRLGGKIVSIHAFEDMPQSEAVAAAH